MQRLSLYEKKTYEFCEYIAIVTIETNDYRIPFLGMNKWEAVNRIKDAALSEKSK